MKRFIALMVVVVAVAAVAAGCGGLSKEELRQYKPPNRIVKITTGDWVSAYTQYVALGDVAHGEDCKGTPTTAQRRVYDLASRNYNRIMSVLDRRSATPKPKSLPPSAPPFKWMREQICAGPTDPAN